MDKIIGTEAGGTYLALFDRGLFQRGAERRGAGIVVGIAVCL
jgi:hypothetical protein